MIIVIIVVVVVVIVISMVAEEESSSILKGKLFPPAYNTIFVGKSGHFFEH
jgi:hypothetical protein